MATRLKTTEWYAGFRATLTDNTLQACNTIKVYIPEFSGTVTFKKCEVVVSWKSGAACPLANLSSRRVDVSIAGAAAMTNTNANLYTASGEDVHYWHAADCTAHFIANWTSGTSQNLIVSVLADMLTSTPVYVDVEATLFMTYEYDDTQTTQIKTVYIPLNAPAGVLATSKPAEIASIPALDTELPETSKTIRSMYILCEGNAVGAGGVTDSTLSMQIDSYTAYVSSLLEMGAATDVWMRFVYGVKYYDSSGVAQGAGMDTSATHSFYIWASIARHENQQVTLVVTYEFDASGSTDCYCSVILPLDYMGIMGNGTTSADYTRGETELWVPEAGIVAKRIAAYLHWEQVGAITGVNIRVGTGSFISYPDIAAVLAGSNGCMVRNDSAISLAQGRNVINVDAYRTDATDMGWGLNGFVIVSYTCDKPTGGYGAANHTVRMSTGIAFDGTSSTPGLEKAYSAAVIAIPEASYFLINYGFELELYTDSTGGLAYLECLFENTSGESGVQWLPIIKGYVPSDPETGLHMFYQNLTDYFFRYPNDPRISQELYGTGLNVGTSRRYSVRVFGPSCWMKLNFLITYNTVTYTVAGTITGCAAATGVDIYVHDVVTGRLVKSSLSNIPVAGEVAYSISVYDQANNLIVSAYQDGTHVGASVRGKAV
jgi:hypothetical protein